MSESTVTPENPIHAETGSSSDNKVSAEGATPEADSAAAEPAAAVAEAVEETVETAAATAEAATEATEAVAEAAEAVAETADVTVEAAAEAATETVEAAAESVEATTEAVAEAATETAEAAAETATEAVEAAAEAVAADAATETAEAPSATDEPTEAKADQPSAPLSAEAAAAVENEKKAEDRGAAAAAAEAKRQKDEAAQARHAAIVADLQTKMGDKEPISGKVIGWNKGGFHVAIDTLAAFCPVSQIEIGNPRSPKRYVDKTFEFMVIEIEKGGRRVVLSRAEALKLAREKKLEVVRDTVKQGKIFTGKVTSITDFGAFVNVGNGIEGLVHISEISRTRVEHPKEVLETGKEVQVKVIKVENGGERISLSMKRLEKDPWQEAVESFPPGTKIEGVIRRKTDFGLFVEVAPGLEGLVHTSRLPIGMTLGHEALEIDAPIECWVQEVEAKRRRMALSMREVATSNPWKGINERYPIGDVVKGTVERLADFGAFIQLEPGLTGLLPFSTLGSRVGNPKRQYHAGKEVAVRVLSIDTQRKRISLGTEQSQAEGTQADYKAYLDKQEDTGGFNPFAAAFAKLQND